MAELHNSPKEENRIIEEKIYQLKERALQRTVQMNLEIKRNTEWTMPKLVENVLTRKERLKEERLKELEQRRVARALRHQLAHQNVLSNVGQWLTKRLATFTKKVKLNKHQDSDDSLSEATSEDIRLGDPIKVPMFNVRKYAQDRNSSFMN
jgi:signal recognition particle GTPase